MNFQLTDGAMTAYLFECAGDPELLGVSRDNWLKPASRDLSAGLEAAHRI